MTPHEDIYEQSKNKLLTLLADGTAAAGTIATQRDIIEEMRSQLTNIKTISKMYASAEEWAKSIYRLLDATYKRRSDAKTAQLEVFFQYAEKQVSQVKSGRDYVVKDNYNGIAYLVTYDQRYLNQAVGAIMNEMKIWLTSQDPAMDSFMLNMDYLLYKFLGTRKDLVTVLKLAQELAVGVEKSEIPIDRPLHVEVAEFGIGLIPYVGSAVALYEAYSGRDIFGYRLTTAERSILAATCILPVVGRFVKGGKAMYTAARMERLYGRDTRYWSKMFGSAETLSKDAKAFKAFREGEIIVKSGSSISKELAIEIEQGLQRTRFPSKSATSVENLVKPEVKSLFDAITKQHPSLVVLDAPAFERILGKGKNIDHIKGQVLEELLEERVNKLLKQDGATGLKALGITGDQLEFIPGHLVRDLKGRQLTDGMIVRRVGNKAEVLAVFEAKSGQASSKGLSSKSGSIAALSEADRKELRMYAKDLMQELEERAKLGGPPVKQTIEDLEKEIIQSELGGQVMTDFERISETRVFVNSVEIKLEISRKLTKFFGVVPKGVRTSPIEKKLKDLKYPFEIFGIDVTAKNLIKMAEDIAKGVK